MADSIDAIDSPSRSVQERIFTSTMATGLGAVTIVWVVFLGWCAHQLLLQLF
jgi:hypothetical protein